MLDDVLMGVVSLGLGAVVAAAEVLRVAAYPLLYGCATRPEKSDRSLVVLIDGECAVCSALRAHVLHRTVVAGPGCGLSFVPAQRVAAALGDAEASRGDGAAAAAAAAVAAAGPPPPPGALLERVHVVDATPGGRPRVLAGAAAVLALGDFMHFPYARVAAAGRVVPAPLLECAYDAFARRRLAWYGRLPAGAAGVAVVDAARQSTLVAGEAAAFLGLLVAWLACVVLPAGDRAKDGPVHAFARAACLGLVVALLARFAPRDADAFHARHVGAASPASLGVLRIACAGILLLFTADVMTAPLEATAALPRWTCKPSGVLGLLARSAPAGHAAGAFARALTSGADAAALRGLERATRALLVAAAAGVATPVSCPLACGAWLLYGGVLHAYNTWRGHSFIAAWWGLAILSWRGGARGLSVDGFLARLLLGRRGAPRGGGDRRGWTRFLVTLVLANNYLMAGLSKLCASGALWASGTNLKTKLLATTLNGRHFLFRGFLSLRLRHVPEPFWTFLGACGLFGEIAMGLVPFGDAPRLAFPAVMWTMHVGILFLQHILFIDLLLLIPAWYLAHAVDGASGGPWDLGRALAAARGARPAAAAGAATGDPDGAALLGGGRGAPRPPSRAARDGARAAALLLGSFAAVWVAGAEFFPWNGFRMFATYEAPPATYHRFVTYDAAGHRGPDWHPHDLSPVLNRKRLSDGLNACADAPAYDRCEAFLAFAAPRAAALPGAPAKLAIQYRSWDYAADLDKAHYCDSMVVLALDVAARTVAAAGPEPCDFVDWDAKTGQTMGTL